MRGKECVELLSQIYYNVVVNLLGLPALPNVVRGSEGFLRVVLDRRMLRGSLELYVQHMESVFRFFSAYTSARCDELVSDLDPPCEAECYGRPATCCFAKPMLVTQPLLRRVAALLLFCRAPNY